MSELPKIQLQTKAILNVPLQLYEDDFCFIVNGEEFHTSRIISELLSPDICHIHQVDPTMSTINIDTKNEGDFSNILKMASFQPVSIPLEEIQFVLEILDFLGNKSFDLSSLHQPLTIDNAIGQLIQQKFIRNDAQISNEVDFIARNFGKFLSEGKSDDLKSLDVDMLDLILSQETLVVKSENQLLKFLNELFNDSNEMNRQDYSNLYRHVIFSNVSTNEILEFIDIFDINCIDSEIWKSISNRLKEELMMNSERLNSARYEKENKKVDSDKDEYDHLRRCYLCGGEASKLCHGCHRFYCCDCFGYHDCQQ